MPNRSKDWLKQAERDMDQARLSQNANHHEWACFAAHQAGEKAVKALHLFHGQEAWGHIVSKLLTDLPPHCNVSESIVEMGKVLDNYYVPARYPNGHPSGAPFEHYGSLQSKEAIKYANEIIKFVRSQMA